MEFFLNRYRNLSVLAGGDPRATGAAGLPGKSNGEVRLIRVWAVSAVTPLARVIESGPQRRLAFLQRLFRAARRARGKQAHEGRAGPHQDGQSVSADRACRPRTAPSRWPFFRQHSPSKTVAAHIIGNTTGAGAKVVIVDRGSTSGIEKGMAVITPDGIVGKVTNVYPHRVLRAADHRSRRSPPA